LILAIALLLQLKNKILKYISILVFVVVFPYRLLFTVARGILLSEIIACVFLFIALFSLLKIKLKYKVLSSLFLLSIFTLFLHSFADKSAVKSSTTLGVILKRYHQYANLVEEKKDNFKARTDISVKLYKKNFAKQPIPQKVEAKQPIPQKVEAKQPIPQKVEVKQLKEYRSLGTAYTNILWRAFVWRDMLTEVFANKAFLGVDFGKPFRSKSVEILRWERGGSTGWLEPHNSYIHILYRTGVIGLLFIIVLWGLFIRAL